MPHFEVECLEKFLVKTTYHVIADDAEQAKQLCRDGKVGYDDHTIEEGGDEFIEVVDVEEVDEDTAECWETGEDE